MHRFAILNLLITSCLFVSIYADMTAEETNNFYLNKLSKSVYNKEIRPGLTKEPVQVNCSMYIIHLEYIPDQKVKMNFYFRQIWTDNRLEFKEKKTTLFGSHALSEQIWKPDTFFPDATEGRYEETTVPNTFVRVMANGNVFMSTRYTQLLQCYHTASSFPVDRLKCSFNIESYGYSMVDIVYGWKDADAVQTGDEFGETVTSDVFKLSDLYQTRNEISLSIGNYSRIGVNFTLKRECCGFWMKSWLPIVISTVLSFVTFCCQKSNVRTAVVVGSSLLTILLVIQISNNSPVKGVVTFMDYFSIISILFTMCAISHEIKDHKPVEKPYHDESLEKMNGKDGEAGEEHHVSACRYKKVCVRKHVVPALYALFLIIFMITMTVVNLS